MKIIHIISTLSKGGGERVMVELANEAAKNGHEVLLVVGWKNDPKYLQDKVSPDVSIEFISSTASLAYFKLFSWLIRKRKIIRSYDILHCHLTYGAVAGSIVYLFHRKFFGYKKPFVVETNHSVGMAVPKHKRWLHSKLSSFRDGIVMMAKDKYWGKFITAHSYIKFELIKNGTSVTPELKTKEERENFLKKKFITSIPKLIVGTVGVLRPDRQPWLYIPIFKAVYEALGDDVGFLMVGDGSEKEKIITLIKEAGIEAQVYLPGLVNDPATVMSKMDVYISLGVRDVAGISMIEAAMCEVPVIGIQLDESYNTRDDDWFWSSHNSKEIAQKLIRLLKNEDERMLLASSQLDFVNAHFNSSAMFNSYLHFYQEIIDKNNHP